MSNNSVASLSPWLNAWHDPLSNLKTLTSCVRLADLNGDGDSKLCVCDLDKKIKVYRGTTLMVEYALLDIPVAMCVTYTDNLNPRVPSVAVAAGSHIFIYRQLRPYRKWTCPPLDIHPDEVEVWDELSADKLTTGAAIKKLTEIREKGTTLSARSAELFSIDTEAKQVNFIEKMKGVAYQQFTLITCMETLNKDKEDIDGVSLLVVGTEAGQILILAPDPNASSFLCKVDLPSAPVLLNVSGVFETEWRIHVTCRDGQLYTIKNGDVRGSCILTGSIVDLGSQAVSMARFDKNLWIATMDRTVSCYSARGKRTHSIVFNDDVSEILVIPVKKAKVGYLLLVALASGEIRLYRDKTLFHSFKVEKPIQAIRYGPYGREENTLIIIHGKGSITVKMWKRTADVDGSNPAAGPPPEQDIPLAVPKKTKLYVEQTQREKEMAADIHSVFQRDLCRLRLEAARAYVKTITEDMCTAGATVGSPDIRIQVKVHGLGPKFLLKMILQNAGQVPITQMKLVVSFDANLYVMGHSAASKQCLSIPMLLPGPKYILETEVLSIDAQGRAGVVYLLLHKHGHPGSLPLLSASVRMPVSELSI